MGDHNTTRLLVRARAAAYLHALVSALLLLWTATVPTSVRFSFFGAYRFLHPFVPLLVFHVAQPGPIRPMVVRTLRPWTLWLVFFTIVFDVTYLLIHMIVRTLTGPDSAAWYTFPYFVTFALVLAHVVCASVIWLTVRRLSSENAKPSTYSSTSNPATKLSHAYHTTNSSSGSSADTGIWDDQRHRPMVPMPDGTTTYVRF